MVSITSGICLFLKYVKLWQQWQMPKTSKNIKLDFPWL